MEESTLGDRDELFREARKILTGQRAQIDEISWAWTTLIDIEEGADLKPGEDKYRKILFRKEWIQTLKLTYTDKSGNPARVLTQRVSGRDIDVRETQYLPIVAVHDAAAAEHLRWPAMEEGAGNDAYPLSNSKLRAQAQAALIWQKYASTGATPTKTGIRADLLRWCLDNGVTQLRGGVMSDDYLDRHVLRDWNPPNI